MWQPLHDRLSSLYLTLTLWQNSPLGKRLLLILGILLGTLLLVYLFVRIILGKRSVQDAPLRAGPVARGMDSEFFKVLTELESAPPPTGDAWMQTYTNAQVLHHAYRFDPEGLPPEQRESLKTHSLRCLDYLKESAAAK